MTSQTVCWRMMTSCVFELERIEKQLCERQAHEYGLRESSLVVGPILTSGARRKSWGICEKKWDFRGSERHDVVTRRLSRGRVERGNYTEHAHYAYILDIDHSLIADVRVSQVEVVVQEALSHSFTVGYLDLSTYLWPIHLVQSSWEGLIDTPVYDVVADDRVDVGQKVQDMLSVDSSHISHFRSESSSIKRAERYRSQSHCGTWRLLNIATVSCKRVGDRVVMDGSEVDVVSEEEGGGEGVGRERGGGARAVVR
ncbi:hypothetical protein Tco_0471493 [Tanacetum coccineum]